MTDISCLPTEIYDQPTQITLLFVEGLFPACLGIQHLKSLRLVSKRFYQSATRILFGAVKIGYPGNGLWSSIHPLERGPESRLSRLCEFEFAGYVRYLEARCARPELMSPYEGLGLKAYHNFLFLLQQLPFLQHFVLHAGVTSDEGLVLDSVLNALQYARPEGLRTLYLDLASQKEVPALESALVDLLPQIYHLYVKWNAKDNTPRAMLDRQSLVREYGQRLQSLRLTGPHQHDMPAVYPLLSPHAPLKHLSLVGIVMSSDAISAIQSYKATLVHLHLFDVHLQAGTWSQLFSELCRFPRLLDMHILSCGYVTAANQPNPPLLHSCDLIESPRSEDESAMMMCVLIMRKRRRAMGEKGWKMIRMACALQRKPDCYQVHLVD
ncbi:uncharacterized protein BP01DRAFT_423964 [Aspergillus saccharolyticus JOP 1030-1]|uniref:F-box domain-containing protein n=1 Tax=Aspergillus saccharolyticus JOP 1030-1 TaxID=1450539 RepID=A0A318ZBT3_9EURO|nr:hypothetical protein BP01DRAFT_423964 [Aspergillus saccharolyticus JOP 1030-1]PYH44769.1 hypothetical protein BP01DRAFT_423964 [Aspergillus saccharolyticus JOP 1030-1]